MIQLTEKEKKIKAEAVELFPFPDLPKPPNVTYTDLRRYCDQYAEAKNKQAGYEIAASKYLPQGEGWISVQDGLPNHSGEVLIYVATHSVYVAHYSPNKKMFTAYGIQSVEITDLQITHWQPLPAAPIDQQKKEEV